MKSDAHTADVPVNRMILLFGASLMAILPAVVALLLGAQPSPANAADANTQAGSFIVTFDESIVKRSARKVEDLEERVDFDSTSVFDSALEGFAAELTEEQVEELQDLDSVLSVTPNHRVRRLGWENRRRGEQAPAGVRRVGAADANRVRQAGAGVAVIDDGIDLNHPDLNAKHGINTSNSPGSSSMPDQGDSHGTHVAGTIGARNNGRGVVGVAPNTPVYAVKVLSSRGEEEIENVLDGIDWVARNAKRLGIKVVNMSLAWNDGSSDYYPSGHSCNTTPDPARKAICNLRERAGVTVVVAAGNDAWSFDEVPTRYTYQGATFPAAYPEVITVTAMSDSDGIPGRQGPLVECEDYGGFANRFLDDWHTEFSNYAETRLGKSHTVAAPGFCVKSTLPGGRYGYAIGTSMASPHVAGLIAACYSENGVKGRCSDLAPDEVIDMVMWESRKIGEDSPNSGFRGDPLNPTFMDGAYFGFLAPKHGGLPKPAEGYPKRHVPETRAKVVLKKRTGKRGTWKVAVRGWGMNAAYGTPLRQLECRIDRKGSRGRWTRCRGGKVVTRLGRGRHVIRIRAVAETGSVDPTPARRVIRLR